MYCESCHERLKSGTRRCRSCGHVVKESPDLGSGSVREPTNPTAYSLPPAPKLVKEEPKVAKTKVEETKNQRFETSVGRIDLLARDAAAGWVIVLIAESDEGKELVGDLLQLMGWVRKHLSAEGQEVRAIVLVDSIPEDLGYAAAAVSDTVEFKLYRVGLTLEKIDV
jgi:hypothetical protein